MDFIIELLVALLPQIFIYQEETRELTKNGKKAICISIVMTISSITKLGYYYQEIGFMFGIIGFALSCFMIFALLKILNNKKKLGITALITYLLISYILLFFASYNALMEFSLLIVLGNAIGIILIELICLVVLLKLNIYESEHK